MHRFVTVTIVLFIGLSLGCGAAMAQSLYDEELLQLSGTLRSLMVRAEKNRTNEEADRLVIQGELIELSKKLHRLEEEASKTDLELLRKGSAPNRQLLLV